MTDYHTHILPGIDDGSRDVAMSLAMLRMLHQQGIDEVACTPHYYPGPERPEDFLIRRAESYAALSEAMDDGMPTLLPGAEFYYYEGISRLDCLPDFALAGKGLLLVEMPFAKWETRWVDELLAIHDRKDLNLMLAHVNRYTRYAERAMLQNLAKEGVAFQINNEAFLSFFAKRRAQKLLAWDNPIYLGSDAHNLGARRPNWDKLPKGLAEKWNS